MKRLPNRLLKTISGYGTLILVLVAGCGEPQKGFRIDGTARGVSDGTEILLRDAVTKKTMDSALVSHERFEFSGLLNERVTRVVITARGGRDFKYFWLENADVIFTAENGKFRYAAINGLTFQQSYDSFSVRQLPLQRAYDSLFDISDGKFSEEERKQISETMQDLQRKITEGEKKFVRDNPGSIVSAHILDIYKTTWGRAVSSELFGALNADVKRSHYGKNVDVYLTLNKDLQIGDQFVDFELPNIEGEKVKASDFKGKYLLIEFWASWCGPCRKENPAMVRLYDEHQSKGFEILAVSLDVDERAWMEAVRKDELPWHNVSNLAGDMTEAAMIYGVAAIPDNVLIDPSGVIIGRNLRGEGLKKQLAKIFKFTMAYGK